MNKLNTIYNFVKPYAIKLGNMTFTYKTKTIKYWYVAAAIVALFIIF